MLNKILDKILNFLVPVDDGKKDPPGMIIDRDVNVDHLHDFANKNTKTFAELKADLCNKRHQDHE